MNRSGESRGDPGGNASTLKRQRKRGPPILENGKGRAFVKKQETSLGRGSRNICGEGEIDGVGVQSVGEKSTEGERIRIKGQEKNTPSFQPLKEVTNRVSSEMNGMKDQERHLQEGKVIARRWDVRRKCTGGTG